MAANSADSTKGTAAVTTAGTEFEAGASVTVTATPTAGNKFTGWTATGITLTEAQKTQNPLTITMPAEDVRLTAAFAAKTNASVTPATANYDKYTENANHKDIEVTLSSGDYTFSTLKNGNAPLTAGTDYTVSGNVYTIKTSYLDKLSNGAQTLTFEMDGGTSPTVAITVADSTPPTYTVTASSTDSAKGTAAVTTAGTAFEAGTSVTVEATTKTGNKFTGWTATGITLTEAQKTQNPLTITMPAGNVTLTAAFAAKTNASVTPTTANYDKYAENANHKDIAVTLTAGDYTFSALKNGSTPLTAGTDYTVSGNVYTIKTSYLDTLAKGDRTLMFEMDGGTNPTVVITVDNSTPIAPPTYTVTTNSADAAKGTVAVKTGTGGPFEAGVRVTIEATPAAGNKFTGWTATGITLTEEQKTQNPLMIFMPAENVTLTAAFAEKINASVTPQAANYDKYAENANHKDIAVTLTTGDYTFRALKNSTTTLTLTAGTDYTVNGNVYTIKTSYLDTLAKGDRTLMFEMDGGTSPTVVITIADSTPTPPPAYTVTANSADAAKGTVAVKTAGESFEEGVRVTIEATPAAGNQFTGWTATGITLTEEQKTQNPLMIFMPAGNVTLTAAFAEKINASVTPQAANYDKYAQSANHKDIAVTLTPGDYAFAALKNGSTALAAGTDYTVNDNIYTIKISYLETLAGGTQTLTFEMDGGANPSVEISITDTTPGQTAHTVTVSAGTGGTARVSGNQTEFLPGEIVTVEAAVGSGYSFGNWKATGASLYPNGTSATFTMPNNDVTVYATFIKDRQSGGGGGGGRVQHSSSATAGAVVVPADPKTDDIYNTNNGTYLVPTVDHVSSNYFADVSTESTWAYGYIEHLASAGIVSGDQNRNFAPKNNVTREEFLKMLMGALNIEATAAGAGFTDVGSGDWFAPYVYTAYNMGIVNGMGDGTFGIGQTITREDMAVMASRALAAAGKTLTQTQQVALVDAVQISDYAQSGVQQLASAGVICGNEHAAFRPQDSALREEATKVIYCIWVA